MNQGDLDISLPTLRHATMMFGSNLCFLTLISCGCYPTPQDNGETLQDEKHVEPDPSFELARSLLGNIPVGDPIPLDTIWANEMPGTRAINEKMRCVGDDTEHVAEEGRLLYEIRTELLKMKPPGPGPAFAVRGHGLDALRQANAILSKGKKPRPRFRASEDISLIFFTYPTGTCAQISGVYASESVFHIQYRFWMHAQRYLTVHVAVIPLHDVKAGIYRIEIENTHVVYCSEVRRPNSKWAEQVVCQSSQFIVTED